MITQSVKSLDHVVYRTLVLNNLVIICHFCGLSADFEWLVLIKNAFSIPNRNNDRFLSVYVKVAVVLLRGDDSGCLPATFAPSKLS